MEWCFTEMWRYIVKSNSSWNQFLHQKSNFFIKKTNSSGVLYSHFVLEIRCPEPILANHSILSVTGNDRMYGRTLIRTAESTNVGATSYKIGALVKYRCERGYKVIGEPLSTCEDNGQWSGDVPQCVCKFPEGLFRSNFWKNIFYLML